MEASCPDIDFKIAALIKGTQPNFTKTLTQEIDSESSVNRTITQVDSAAQLHDATVSENATRFYDPLPSIITITKEVSCREPLHLNVKHLDFTKEAVPPNSKRDILILTSGVARESGEMLFQRTTRIDMWFIYITITIIYILFIVSVISGINSSWYKNLNKSNVNPYFIGILWAFSTFFSYGAIFMIWEHVNPNKVTFDFILSLYFLIGAF
jgi:hypothetical protein